MLLNDSAAYPSLGKLIRAVLTAWPEHERFLEKSFKSRDQSFLAHSERLSDIILRLAEGIDGELAGLANDYRFLCEKIVLPEELYFRRNQKYRLSSFQEALNTVYNDRVFMTRYMNGLLLSDVLWSNHCGGLNHYANVFLKSLPSESSLLEIGPGHGLLLYLASEAENVARLSAWDVSESSLEMSRHALKRLGAHKQSNFELRNIFEPAIMSDVYAGLFDCIVLSEVLEHVEQPEQAIRVLHHLCKPGGRVWINVPANSPAPDHLYLVRQPEQAEDLLRAVGFKVVDTCHLPMTGVTLERALKNQLTITCIMVGERGAS